MKIILDNEYLLKDRDIIKVKCGGVSCTRYAKELDISQSLIDGTMLISIEDFNRERYCIDDYMGFSVFKFIEYENLIFSKRSSSDGDYRSACDILEVRDSKSDFEMIILTNFND